MIDIFHPERLSINLGRRVQNCLHETLIQRLFLVSSMNRMTVKYRNLYLNQGVQDRRSYYCVALAGPWNSNLSFTSVMLMNLMTVPIAMSKAHIDTDICGSAVQFSTKRLNVESLNSANNKVPKRFPFSRKLETWCFHLKKEPTAAILIIPRQNGVSWWICISAKPLKRSK